MTKIKIIILTIIGFFLISGNIYASDWTYEYKSKKGRESDQIVLYKDGTEYKTIENSTVEFKDIGIEKKGKLTKGIIDKIKNAYLNLYISRVEDVLHSGVSLGGTPRFLITFTPSGTQPLPSKRTLFDLETRKWIEEEVFTEEEILAYNCSSLLSKLQNSKKNYNFEEQKDFENTNENYKTVELSSNITSLKNEYLVIKNSYNILFCTSGSAIQSLKEVRAEVPETSSEGSDSSTQVEEKDYTSTGTGDWWKDAQNFFKTASAGDGSNAATDLTKELSDMIFDVGNMIFIIVTSILGLKYILGSAEGKAQVKDSLITLIVAALFFYGWEAIKNLLDIEGLLSSGTMVDTASKIYNTVLFVVNLLAIGGIIWIGVKYMMSSAEGKAEIKTSWGPLILGIVMVYATIKFLTTVITVILGN